MKIYIQDNGWRGAFFCIANSKEEAIELMKKHFSYEPRNDISEHDIAPGFIYVNIGC